MIEISPFLDTMAATPTTATTTASPGCSTTLPATWRISTSLAWSPRLSRSTTSSTRRMNEYQEIKIFCHFLSDAKKKDKNWKIFETFHRIIGSYLVTGGSRSEGKQREIWRIVLRWNYTTGESRHWSICNLSLHMTSTRSSYVACSVCSLSCRPMLAPSQNTNRQLVHLQYFLSY